MQLKYRITKSSLLIIIFLTFNIVYAFGQCGCPGSTPIGGLSPVGGTTDNGIIPFNSLRYSAFYRYSAGNSSLNKDMTKYNPQLKSFEDSYLGLNFGYGVNERIDLEAEFGYFLNKSLNYYYKDENNHGASHILAMMKYLVIDNYSNDFEYSISGGIKVPLGDAKKMNGKDTIPLPLQASNGAFGFVVQNYFHQGFPANNYHLFFINRFEYTLKNPVKYQYGPALYNGLFIAKNLIGNLDGILELRNEIKFKDYQFDKVIAESGSMTLTLAPQVNYSFGDFRVSAIYDIALYKYFYGLQLNPKNTFTISIGHKINL